MKKRIEADHAGKIVLLVTVAISILCFASCGKPAFSENDIFAEYRISPSWGALDLMYDTVYQVYGDGRLILFASPHSENLPDKIFETEIELSDVDIKELQDIIAEADFMSLKKNVTSPSDDGDYHTITVTTKTRVHEVSGLNPDNSRFTEVAKAIRALVPEQDAREWRNDVYDFLEAESSKASSEPPVPEY